MRTQPEDFQFFINNLSQINHEELKRGMESDHQQTETEYKEFTKYFSEGKCYLCFKSLIGCDYSKPCIHWLLRGHKRIKKKHIEQALKTKELFHIIPFLHWIASYEAKLTNINDFEAYEERKDLVYQETIRYKNIAWTFWVKEGDLQGHNSRHTNFPHYHIHMTIDGNRFINFSDLHLPLSEWDILNIHSRRGKFPNFKFITPYGETYSDLFANLSGDQLLNTLRNSKDASKAQFHLQTMVKAKPGKTIKGDDIAKLAREHNETGIPMAVLLKKLDADVKVIVTPHNLVDPVLRDESKSGR